MSDVKEIRELPRAIDTKAALIEASQKLRSLDVEFALIGGLALAFYGIERYTKDVDFAVTITTSGKAEVAFRDSDPKPLQLGGISIMTSQGVGSAMGLTDKQSAASQAVSACSDAYLSSPPLYPGVRANFIDRRLEYSELFEEALSVANKKGPWCRVENELIAVIPLPYLVALKLIADRPQDEADLKALLLRNTFDYTEAREIVTRRVGSFAARYLDKLSRAVGRLDAPKDYLTIES
jgi:hypothetical protein